MGIKTIDQQATDLARIAVSTLLEQNLLEGTNTAQAEKTLRARFREQLNILNIAEFPEFVHERLILLDITTVDRLRSLAQSDFDGIKTVGYKKLDIFVAMIKARYGIDIPTAPSKISPDFARRRSVNTIASLVDINFIQFQTSPTPIATIADLKAASEDHEALCDLVSRAYDAQYPSKEAKRRDLDIMAIMTDIFRELRKLGLG